MKFLVSTSSLLKQLSAVVGVIPSNPVVPILENFLFEIKEGVLHVTASDLQTSIITQVAVEAEEDGSIAIPAKMLVDTLKNLPDQPVTFHIEFDSYSIELSSDNGRYKLTGENATDFPRTPELTRSDAVTLPSEVMADAINYTLFATSNDDMKPAMNGVFFNIGQDYANFVASDSHRLIRYRRDDLRSEDDIAIIIHKKALALLKNMLPADSTELKVEFNSSNAIFTFADTKLICRLIDERFPDYENVIPVNNDNTLVIDREDLLRTLKRIVIYANKSTNQVRLKISGNEMQVSAEDLDFSNEASERLYCEHNGADIEIGFNARFLIEILNNIDAKQVSMKLAEPSSAGLIIPMEQAEQEDILMLVMPIMLHNYV